LGTSNGTGARDHQKIDVIKIPRQRKIKFEHFLNYDIDRRESQTDNELMDEVANPTPPVTPIASGGKVNKMLHVFRDSWKSLTKTTKISDDRCFGFGSWFTDTFGKYLCSKTL